jgi:hypothetical protein
MKNHELQKNVAGAIIIGVILFIFLSKIIPLLPKILAHPDEYQFYTNAWSILSGKQLTNFLHVAFTEYSLASFLAVANIVTKPGVNFPQGTPSIATYFFGRIFGLMLLFLTYLIGCLILQKGEKVIKVRTIIFTALLFGSIGVFERFIRVNSDSMSIFVFLNYVLFSVWLHRRRASPFQFFLLNLVFIFLSSFTNFKTLYLDLPLFAINSIVPFIRYHQPSNRPSLPALYQLVFYPLGVIAGTVVLWAVFIPRPVDYKTFWYSLKNTTVQGVSQIYEYPDMAGKSGLVYLYDLFANQLGFSMAAGIFLLIMFSLIIRFRQTISAVFSWMATQVSLSYIKKDNFPDHYLELILFLSFLSYLGGIGTTLIHFSRWGTPLAVLFLMLVSGLLEQVFFILNSAIRSLAAKLILVVFLFALAWNLMFTLVNAIEQSDYPTENGFKSTVANVKDFIGAKNIAPQEELKTIAWNVISLGGVRGIGLEDLILPENAQLKYLLWPHWNMSVLYDKYNVNKETHIQKVLINKYAQNVEFRFPSLMAKYMHLTKKIAWEKLHLSWHPEIESLTEAQFGALTLKELEQPISVTYEVPYSDLEHFYDSSSRLFNLKTVVESYAFPPCTSNPYVISVADGHPIRPSQDPYNVSRNAGYYCHSLAFRVMPRGIYKIQIKGLPKNDPDLRLYSAYDYGWDPQTQTLTFLTDRTLITAAFGVAGKEKEMPNLKFIVNYTMTPPPPPKPTITPSP